MTSRRMVLPLFVVVTLLLPAAPVLSLTIGDVTDQQPPQTATPPATTGGSLSEKNVATGTNHTDAPANGQTNTDPKAVRDAACKKQEETGEPQFDREGVELCPGFKSAVELALGYTVVRSNDTELTNADALPVGWSVGFAAKLAPWFAVVSELSAAYDSEGAVLSDTHRTAVYFLNGVRGIFPFKRVRVFGDLLAGVAHDWDFRPGQTDKNRFAVRPGVGVDFRLSTKVSFRFHAGWTLDAAGDDSPEVFQLTTGLVFGR